MDALASDGPISDADVKNAVKHWRSAIEDEARAEERERIMEIVRDTSHDWLEIETRLSATDTEERGDE